MEPEPGLRARKKQRTHQAISEAAITLFLRHGFDAVSVADIAAAAEVSKPTLFKYFPTKEDLVVHRFADHQEENATVVRNRIDADSPLTALHRHFLDGLDRRDPVTGLNDHPGVIAFQRLVFGTPSLAARLLRYLEHAEQALATALADAAGTDPFGITARIAAKQISTTQQVLADRTWRSIAAGESADQVYPDAVAAAGHAFGLLRDGLGGYCG